MQTQTKLKKKKKKKKSVLDPFTRTARKGGITFPASGLVAAAREECRIHSYRTAPSSWLIWQEVRKAAWTTTSVVVGILKPGLRTDLLLLLRFQGLRLPWSLNPGALRVLASGPRSPLLLSFVLFMFQPAYSFLLYHLTHLVSDSLDLLRTPWVCKFGSGEAPSVREDGS